jgi:hypothetical protein
MKTLWQRLSKENKAKLKETKRLSPAITNKLIEALKIEVGFTQLKLEQVIFLLQVTNQKRFDINPLIDLFDGK